MKISQQRKAFLFQNILRVSATLSLIVAGFYCNSQNTINYSYDAKGQLVSEEYGSEYAMAFQYDEEGNIISKTVMDTTSVSQNSRVNGITVFPNPTRSGFVIKYDFADHHRPEIITLYSLSGAIIEYLPINKSKARIEYNNELAPGTYILKAGKNSQKIVILE